MAAVIFGAVALIGGFAGGVALGLAVVVLDSVKGHLLANTRKLADYIKEAKRDPFPLELSDHTVEVPCPTASDVVEASRSTDPENALRLVCGLCFDEIWVELQDAPYPALNTLVDDIIEHFNGGVSRGESKPPARKSTATAKQ